MNCKCCCKDLLKPAIAGFAFIFLFEYLWHHMVMGDIYTASMSVWRPEAESMDMFHWVLLAQFLTAAIFVYIFKQGVEDKGIMEGLRFGKIIALLFSVMSIYAYVFQPIPGEVIIWWIVGYFIQFPLLGLLVAKVCGTKKA